MSDPVESLDRRILELSRCAGALRLRVGELLEGLCRAGGHGELGFSSSAAYIKERCRRGARWGQEARALARRLAGLPRMRRALLTGRISWSMAQVLVGCASPENEAALLEEADGATVRAMRERLRARATFGEDTGAGDEDAAVGEDVGARGENAGAGGGDPKAGEDVRAGAKDVGAGGGDRSTGREDTGASGVEPATGGEGTGAGGAEPATGGKDERVELAGPQAAAQAEAATDLEEEESPRRLVTASLTREEVLMWEATLKLVSHVAGRRMSLDDCVEAVLAEAWTALLTGVRPGTPIGSGTVGERRRQRRAREAVWRRHVEQACEKNIPVEGADAEKAAGDERFEERFAGGIPTCRLSWAAWRRTLRGNAARVEDALTGGMDPDAVRALLREKGLPSSLEEVLRVREAAADPAIAGVEREERDRSAPGLVGADAGAAPSPAPQRSAVARPEELDREIRSLVGELQTRDLELGRLLLDLFRANGWRRLGYATRAQYARERVGMSLAGVKARITLVRRLEGLPEVAAAAERLGYESTRLVARAAVPRTAAAWVERARQRTVKHLREEVEAMELLARCEGAEGMAWGPPDGETLEAVFEAERVIARGGAIRGGRIRMFAAEGDEARRRSEEEGQMSAPPSEERCAAAGSEDQAGGQMSAPASEERCAATRSEGPAGGQMSALGGKRLLRLNLREDVADLWDSVRALWMRLRTRLGLPSFARTLCWSTWHAWAPTLGPRGVAYEAIYQRDRFRCTSPVCERTDNTPHHLTFRSHGGTEHEENLTTLCSWCHLEGVHQDRLRADPPASQIFWRIGRAGVLRVVGRELLPNPAG